MTTNETNENQVDGAKAHDWRVCRFELPIVDGKYWRHALRNGCFDILRNEAVPGKYLLLEMPPREISHPSEYGMLDVNFRSLHSLMMARASIPIHFDKNGVSFELDSGTARIIDAASDVYHAHPRTIFVGYRACEVPSIGSLWKEVVANDEPLDDVVVRFFDAMVGRARC